MERGYQNHTSKEDIHNDSKRLAFVNPVPLPTVYAAPFMPNNTLTTIPPDHYALSRKL